MKQSTRTMMEARTDTVNIGPRERRLRRLLGILLLFLTVFAAVPMAWLGAAPAWCLILFPFYYQGVRFLLDYQTGTCPLKAELGQEKLDAVFSIFGTRIENENRISAIRSKSRRALAISLVVAAVLTAVTYVVISST